MLCVEKKRYRQNVQHVRIISINKNSSAVALVWSIFWRNYLWCKVILICDRQHVIRGQGTKTQVSDVWAHSPEQVLGQLWLCVFWKQRTTNENPQLPNDPCLAQG